MIKIADSEGCMVVGVLFRPLLANLRVAALTILKRNWDI
jgi:hypothetical protein